MPHFLRQINKSKWYRNPGVPWLGEGELQADALRDLKTTGNELSVYHVQEGETNLVQIITALAAGRDSVANFDYALISQEVVTTLQIKVKQSPGETRDATVNEWHRDLCELSADKVMDLARAIQNEADKRRILGKKLLGHLREAIRSGRIDRDRLKPQLKAKLEQTQG